MVAEFVIQIHSKPMKEKTLKSLKQIMMTEKK